MDRTQFQKHIDDLLELALKDSNQTAKHKNNGQPTSQAHDALLLCPFFIELHVTEFLLCLISKPSSWRNAANGR